MDKCIIVFFLGLFLGGFLVEVRNESKIKEAYKKGYEQAKKEFKILKISLNNG